jgi:hypothetical protein
MSFLSSTTVAAIVTPLVLLGPPRLTVAAGAAGQPLTVTVEHFDEVAHIQVSARIVTLVNGQTVERSVSVVETEETGANRRSFLLTPSRTTGVPAVVVVRGTHGEDGPFMEAMVQVDGAGAVVGISYPKRKPLVGGWVSPRVSDDDIADALRDLRQWSGAR